MGRLCEALSPAIFQAVKSITHSPLIRARQSAELLKSGLNLRQPLVQRDGLRPEDNPLPLISELLTGSEDVLLVGHNPHLSILADALMLGKTSGGLIDFKKAGFLCLKRVCAPTKQSPYGDWMLSWYVVPRILEQ